MTVFPAFWRVFIATGIALHRMTNDQIPMTNGTASVIGPWCSGLGHSEALGERLRSLLVSLRTFIAGSRSLFASLRSLFAGLRQEQSPKQQEQINNH
jgi:hypothetical protein